MPVSAPVHRPAWQRTEREREREYDRRRAGAERRALYKTQRWKKARARYLAEHPLCVKHAAQGRIAPSTTVDHRLPHKGDEALFWDEGNWQALCTACHNRDKQREERGGRGG